MSYNRLGGLIVKIPLKSFGKINDKGHELIQLTLLGLVLDLARKGCKFYGSILGSV